MPHRLIDRIREKIRLRDYDMTVHAVEEMAEDDLDLFDIEQAVLTGQLYARVDTIRVVLNTRLKARLWMARE